jgi:hypothetical protein
MVIIKICPKFYPSTEITILYISAQKEGISLYLLLNYIFIYLFVYFWQY